MHGPSTKCLLYLVNGQTLGANTLAKTLMSIHSSEKYLATGKYVFWAFMDLEKAYDTINENGMRQVLRVNVVGRILLKALQSFYVDSRTCVKVGMGVSGFRLMSD